MKFMTAILLALLFVSPALSATANATPNATANATPETTDNVTPPTSKIEIPSTLEIEDIIKPPRPGSLKKIVGHVFVVVEGEPIRLFISDVLFDGDIVQTSEDGMVSILIGPEETLSLNEESVIEITELGNNLTGPVIRMGVGEIYIEKKASERFLSIRASDNEPGMNITSLRGSFSVKKREGVITIKVYSGSVEVCDDAKNVTVRVRENERISVNEGELPPTSPEEFAVADRWWAPLEETGICGVSMLIIFCALFVGLLKKN